MNGKELLEEAAKTRNCTDIARDLGMSRATISLVLRGKYIADPSKVYAAAERAYGQVMCPFIMENITHAECRFHQSLNPGPLKPDAEQAERIAHRTLMRFTRACRSCDKGIS